MVVTNLHLQGPGLHNLSCHKADDTNIFLYRPIILPFWAAAPKDRRPVGYRDEFLYGCPPLKLLKTSMNNMGNLQKKIEQMHISY